MAKPLDQAIKERREREAGARRRTREPGGDPPPLKNGHDPHSHVDREISVVGLHELTTIEASDNLIGGIIGDEQFGMVYGESGSGKSFLTFDMAMHFALGREWMGRKVAGGGVLYIAAEGRGGWAHRVEAWCRHHGIDEESRALCPFGFILETINLGRTGNGDIDRVIRAADAFAKKIDQPVKLISVDTMARATPGSNENDAGDMSAFVNNMDRVRQRTKAAVALVHHSGKNASLGARGHSSLRAAVDVELEVERADGGRILHIRKNRDGSDGGQQAFNLQVVEIGEREEGDKITSCVVVPADAAQVTSSRRGKTRKLAKWQLAADALNEVLMDSPVDSYGATGNTRTTLDAFRKALTRAAIIDPPEVNPTTGKTKSTHRAQWTKIRDELIGRKIIKVDGEQLWRIDV